MVKKLEVDSSAAFDHLCSSCMHKKFHKLSLLDFSFPTCSKIKLLVIDLTGPISVPTWNGNLYALIVIEVSYCYLVRKVLKSKKEVGIAVYDIVSMLKCQSDTLLDAVHT